MSVVIVPSLSQVTESSQRSRVRKRTVISAFVNAQQREQVAVALWLRQVSQRCVIQVTSPALVEANSIHKMDWYSTRSSHHYPCGIAFWPNTDRSVSYLFLFPL